LGAESRQIISLVMRGGLSLVIAGVGLGWIVALGSGRFVSNLLYGVSPRDAAVYAGVAALLFGVGALATALPAWRATKVDIRAAMAAE
jgi:ABC-type antimicrobial peptide transport system permease subunit